MEHAFSESNRRKVLALHLNPLSTDELAANPAACQECGGVGHIEAPQTGFFRATCDRCNGSGQI